MTEGHHPDDPKPDYPPPAPPRGLSLGRNVAWSVTGNLALAGTQWLALIVLAQLGTPTDIGLWALATALVTPIFTLCDMAMNDAHTVDDLTDFKRADYFALRLVGAVTASVTCILVALVWFGDQSALVAATLAFVAVRFINSQMMLNGGVFQRERRVDLLARSSLIRGVLGVTVFAVVFWLTQTLWAALLGQALAWGLVLFLVDRPYLSLLGVGDRFTAILHTRPQRLVRLFIWLLPLALSAMLISATVSAPRLVLGSYVDLATVGIFGAIAYFDTGFTVAINAIGFASASFLRSTIRDRSRKRFVLLSMKLVGLTSSIALVLYAIGWLYGDEILALVYGSDYVDHTLLMLVLLATAVRSALAPLQVALTAGHVLWRRFFVNALGFVSTLGTAVTLVPEQGVYGAAIALLVGACTRAVLLIIFFVRMTLTMHLAPANAVEEDGR